METIGPLIESVLAGNQAAYASLVHRFQDMAVGYAYSLLHDFHLAEDAAQEAFFEAYRTLAKLREPAAFPGWFRRIVFKQCDRITRVPKPVIVPLHIVQTASTSGNPSDALEENEMRASLQQAIESLREHER